MSKNFQHGGLWSNQFTRQFMLGALLTLAITMQGALYTGFFVNPLDIASNFSGTILGITNAFGTIPGWLAPLIAGALTRESVSYFVFRSHPFKASANFSQFLTPTPLPSAVFYYYPSENLTNF